MNNKKLLYNIDVIMETGEAPFGAGLLNDTVKVVPDNMQSRLPAKKKHAVQMNTKELKEQEASYLELWSDNPILN